MFIEILRKANNSENLEDDELDDIIDALMMYTTIFLDEVTARTGKQPFANFEFKEEDDFGHGEWFHEYSK